MTRSGRNSTAALLPHLHKTKGKPISPAGVTEKKRHSNKRQKLNPIQFLARVWIPCQTRRLPVIISNVAAIKSARIQL